MLSEKEISKVFQEIQNKICRGLEELDGKGKFIEDNWTRDRGGGGRSRVLSHGSVIEKGGVNFSAVHGEIPLPLQKEFGTGIDFYATGVSIVLHPINPWVPIIHMNIRYFQMTNGKWWFGGGIDLTPHYIRKEQAALFHKRMKSVCDLAHPSFYGKYKKWADDYFYNDHREETRGVGGIFFDHLNENSTPLTKQELFDFVSSVGRSFVAAYKEQVELNRDLPFGEREIQWQRIRRGRYVEFNLVYDRGTKFGLETKGRIESILMSLPEHASWYYNFIPETGSLEEKTQNLLRKDIDWIAQT